MDYLVNALRRRFFQGDFELLHLKDELYRLQRLLTSLALDGESSSLIIVGRRGIGKRRLLTQAIHEVQKNDSIKSNLLVVHLDGLIHTDDRSALRAMAHQLHRESLMESMAEEDATDQTFTSLNEPKSFNFSQQLRCFIDSLQTEKSSERNNTMSLLIVLYEFDLFALHHNQILLYNLFDCCQSSSMPIAVIGVTCRLDIMELLEKRVKSRFSHRQIHLLSIAAPRKPTADEGEVDVDTSSAFDRYCEACQHFLSISPANRQLMASMETSKEGRRNVDATLATWNRQVKELMADEIVVDTLRQAWSLSVSLQHLVILLTPIVARLGPGKTSIDPVEFIDSLCALRQDAKINSLKGLSVLELFIIAALVKLQDMHRGDQLVNFELLYSEYARFCRTNCPGYLYEKPVVYKALDNLIDQELVVTGRAAIAASATVGRQQPLGGGAGSQLQLPNYRPLYCFVDQPVLSACLDSYSNCPVELTYWIHSKRI